MSGIRFRKDGTLGKLQETLNFPLPTKGKLKNESGVPDGHRPMLAKPCRGLTTSAQTRHASGEIDQGRTQVIDNRGKPGRTNQWYDPCWRQLGDGAAEHGNIRMTVQAGRIDDAVGNRLVLVECKRPRARKALTRGFATSVGTPILTA